MKNMKRILEVKIVRMIDTDPDTSYLGEYSNTAKTEFAIDRAHSEDCQSLEANHFAAVDKLERVLAYLYPIRKQLGNNAEDTEWEAIDSAIDTVAALQEDLQECDCGGHGDMGRNEFRYFNGPVENYKGESPEDIRKYVRQDYDRMEGLNNQNWHYLGIRAEAEIYLDILTMRGLAQTITSGGLWGTESDSEESYLKSIEQEELSDLKTQLLALGFSKRAISSAFKNVEEVSE